MLLGKNWREGRGVINCLGLLASVAFFPIFGCQRQEATSSEPVTFPAMLEDASSIDSLVPHAGGVSLAEVLSLEEQDSRPACGDLCLVVKLRTLQSTGVVSDKLYLVKKYGGASPRGPAVTPPPSPLLLKMEKLTVGAKYWFAFETPPRSNVVLGKVVNVWPAGTSRPAIACKNAVRDVHFKWNPIYDTETGLTYGRKISEADTSWSIRISRSSKVLWQKEIRGTMANRSSSWGCWGQGLAAETSTHLAEGNEFGLAPDIYYVKTVYDMETGERLSTLVTRHQAGLVNILYQEYKGANGGLSHEVRYGTEGGYMAKNATYFDDEGKPTKVQEFVYQTAPPYVGWIEVE